MDLRTAILEQRVKELETALKPFADAASDMSTLEDSHCFVNEVPPVGAFRKAKKLFTETTVEELSLLCHQVYDALYEYPSICVRVCQAEGQTTVDVEWESETHQKLSADFFGRPPYENPVWFRNLIAAFTAGLRSNPPKAHA